MMKKMVVAAILGMVISNPLFAVNLSTITLRNYTTGLIAIKVYNANNVIVADTTIPVNAQIGPFNWVTAESLPWHDVFDAINVFYVDKSTGVTFHCGDIPGGPIPYWTTLNNTYEIDQCDDSAFRWHPVV